jgi:hypothetical protein
MENERTLIEQIFHRSIVEGNLHIWGRLYVDKLGQTPGGWLVDSWSENGAPYWQPDMHWLANKDKVISRVHLNIGVFNGLLVHGEDKEIEPERAKFIRATVAKWEQEWLAEEAKKLG